MKLFLKFAFVALAACSAAGLVPTAIAQQQPLVLKNANVIPAPDKPTLHEQTILMLGGNIVAMGEGAEVNVPDGSTVLDCTGMTVVSGYWNSHVHFTESAWDHAEHGSLVAQEDHLQQMLTRWGFVRVWDLGSEPSTTKTIQLRILNGELAGPEIFRAGPIYPQNGHPWYLPASMHLPEAGTNKEAATWARRFLSKDGGDNGVKLFTGSYQGEGKPVVHMDTATAMGAVNVAHEKGKPVFAHPQDWEGTDAALKAGVDVLAHTIPTEPGWTMTELALIKAQKTALTPTLALWHTVMAEEKVPQAVEDNFIQRGVDELKAFIAASPDGASRVLFGTDVGFMHEYDTNRELQLMGRVMTWQQVLASLTTNPCEEFKKALKIEKCGRVETGSEADLVVLTANPARDVANLARVAYTIRDGRVIYSARR